MARSFSTSSPPICPDQLVAATRTMTPAQADLEDGAFSVNAGQVVQDLHHCRAHVELAASLSMTKQQRISLTIATVLVVEGDGEGVRFVTAGRRRVLH